MKKWLICIGILIIILGLILYLGYGKEYLSLKVIKDLPLEMPKDFNFVLDYGVGAKNQINTFDGTYTNDMVMDPSITIKLKLSDSELNYIYSEMKKIKILSYPDTFVEENNVKQTPFLSYNFKVQINGVIKNITWDDKECSKSEKAVQLRNFYDKICNIIYQKEEYKKLPTPKGAYC